MSEEARRAYVSAVRAHARGLQNFGFICCAVGVVIMVAGHYVHGAPPWAVYAGLLIIFFGWAVFAFAIVRRTAYVRANPFEPDR
jgi:hypothetical protein